MGFSNDKIPYDLVFGLDVTTYSDSFANNLLMDIIDKLDEYKIDYVISNVSINCQKSRKESLTNFAYPIFLNDYSLLSYEWKNKLVGKLHSADIENFQNNLDVIEIDVEYCNHINTRYILSDIPDNIYENLFSYVKMFKRFLSNSQDRMLNFIIDFNEQGLKAWQIIHSEFGYSENISVVLKMNADLPSEVSI